MNKTAIFLFSFFLCVTLLNPSWAMDRESLRKLMNYPIGNAGLAKMQSAAMQNLNLVEEIIFFSDFTENNETARDNGLSILSGSADVGVYPKERYFNTFLRLYSQAASIVRPSRLERLKRMIIASLASFGMVDSSSPFSSNFSNFPTLVNSMASAGLIKNQGILNSLAQKLSNAKDILDKKGPNAKTTAINKIQAAVNELDAQRGNGVSEDGYQILSGYCKNLISKLQATNL